MGLCEIGYVTMANHNVTINLHISVLQYGSHIKMKRIHCCHKYYISEANNRNYHSGSAMIVHNKWTQPTLNTNLYIHGSFIKCKMRWDIWMWGKKKKKSKYTRLLCWGEIYIYTHLRRNNAHVVQLLLTDWQTTWSTFYIRDLGTSSHTSPLYWLSKSVKEFYSSSCSTSIC